MVALIEAFEPAELVVLVVALVGLLPILTYYREETRWLTFAYGFLLIGAVATNLEAVVLPGVVNLGEHVLGVMGAGVAFAVAAYMHRRDQIETDDGPDGVEG